MESLQDLGAPKSTGINTRTHLCVYAKQQKHNWNDDDGSTAVKGGFPLNPAYKKSDRLRAYAHRNCT